MEPTPPLPPDALKPEEAVLLPPEPEAPVEAVLIEPPMVRPARPRPGPNIGMALVWTLALFAGQIAASIGAFIVVVIIALAVVGPESLKPAKGQEFGANLFDLPGAVPIFFIAGTGSTVLLAVGLVGILYRRKAPRFMALRGLSPWHAILVILMVPPMLLVGGELQTTASEIPHMPRLSGNQEIYEKLGQESWAMILFAGCLLPAVGEELFFRGFLSRGLIARHGLIAGTLLASLLFGVVHLDPPQVLATALLALAFQAVFLCTKSLLGSMLFHGLNNALAFTLMRLARDPAFRQVLGVDDSHVPPLLVAAALTATVALGWLLYLSRTRWVLPDGGIWSPGYVTADMPPPRLEARPRVQSAPISAFLVAVVAYLTFVAVLMWEFRQAWQG